jgi:hypothetical protein
VNEDRARDAAEHLQAAVHELIAAGQALLGALDDVVERREAAPDLFSAFEAVARRFIPPSSSAGSDDEHDGGDDDDGYEPIRLD